MIAVRWKDWEDHRIGAPLLEQINRSVLLTLAGAVFWESEVLGQGRAHLGLMRPPTSRTIRKSP